MTLGLVEVKDKCKKVAGGAAVLLASALLAAGVNQALARFYNPGLDHLQQLQAGIGLAGKLRGTGLPLDSKVEITILTQDAKVTKATAKTGSDGSLLLQNFIDLDPDSTRTELYISLYPDSARQSELVLKFNSRQSTLNITGRGFETGKAISVSLAPNDRYAGSPVTDWTGTFNTGLIRNSGSLQDGMETCVGFPHMDNQAEICFEVSLGSKGFFTLADSPYSTWDPPNGSFKTPLSVQDSGHINSWQQALADNHVKALMAMTQQFSVLMVQQAEVIGTFFDAKHQLEVQRWIQEKQAETHRDYHPSRQICYYATFVQDFASLSRLSEMNAEAINAYMFDREMAPAAQPSGTMALGSGAPAGEEQDRFTRISQLQELYCSPDNNNLGGLRLMCPNINPSRYNRDINYTYLDTETTLDINFQVPENTGDETDLLALSKNLFSHDLMERLDRSKIFDEQAQMAREGARHVLDIRSIIALRGPIRDSFSQIVALRGTGGGLSTQYIRAYLENMGMDAQAIEEIIGPNPSELGLLNVMMNKMPQNPHFYTETYDTEANVERTRAAQQAIDNLGGRQAFEAALRREMLLATRLEIRLREVQNKINAQVQEAIETYGATGGGTTGPVTP